MADNLPPRARERGGDDRRVHWVDVTATVLLLCAHVGLAIYTAVTSLFLVMTADACAYQPCGDEQWVTRAIYVAMGGGALTVLIDIVLAIMLLDKSRIAFYVPLAGCAAQVAVAILVLHMASLAGPTP